MELRPITLLGSLVRDKRLLPFFLGGVALVLGAACLVIDPLLVLAALVGGVVVLLVLEYPFFGIILYLLVQYLRIGDLFPQLAVLRPAMAVVGLTAVSFLLHVLIDRKLELERHPIFITFAIFVGIVALSVPGSIYQTFSFMRFQDMARLLVGVFLMIHVVRNRERFSWVIWTLLSMFGGMSIVLIVGYLLGLKRVPDTGGSGGMIGGFLGDGNDYSLAVNIVLPIALFYLFIQRSAVKRLLLMAFLGVYAGAVICTTSRGGFLGMAAVFLISLISYRKVAKLMLVPVFSALLIFVLVFLGAPNFFEEKVKPYFNPEEIRFLNRLQTIKTYEQDESARGRLDAWGAGLRMTWDHPIIGVGAGAFSTAYGLKYKPSNAVAATWREAHSVYFQIMGELGLLGIGCFLTLVGLTLGTLSRLRRLTFNDPEHTDYVWHLSMGLTISVIAFLVTGAFLSAGYYPHIYYLGFLAVALRHVAVEQFGGKPAWEREQKRRPLHRPWENPQPGGGSQ